MNLVSRPPADSTPARSLGTFAVVFTPSILTILGVVLFLRLGYVVGGAGLAHALVVIAAANAISVLTSLSVSAISTNLRVEGGGDYYLISRTPGLAFGGAIGVVAFLAQAVSIGFYAIGFAEAAAPSLPFRDPRALHLVAGATIAALAGLAWLGADLATRVQYVVMAALALALAAFAMGAFGHFDRATLEANWSPPPNALAFGAAFALFFPAVTGFTQGVSMSGDLAHPGRSIPLGVLSAVGLSVLIYLGGALLLAGSVPGDGLRADYASMKRVAEAPLLIDVGVMAATLSSALASFLGAPRILQSLAKDGVFPWLAPFAAGTRSGNPRRAVIPTLLIALAVAALGNLNAIAAVVSMFFLVSYGLLNWATYVEARPASPSFRPTFRFFDHRLALVAAIACLAAMVAIDALAGVAAALVVAAIYRYLTTHAAPATWADGRRANHMKVAREHLLLAEAQPEHALAWRPQVLLFSDSTERRARLLSFATWIEAGGGLTTVVRMAHRKDVGSFERQRREREALAAEIDAQGSSALPLVVVGTDTSEMVSTIVQAAGVGPFRINTVVVNWPRKHAASYRPLGLDEFGANVTLAFRLGCNLLLLDADAREWETIEDPKSGRGVIDVWWEDASTGELMLLVAYLMTRSARWRDATIRLLGPAEVVDDAGKHGKVLRERLEEIRIDAEVVVAGDHDPATVARMSAASSLALRPFRIHGGRFYSPFGWEIATAIDGLPIVLLCLAAQDVDLEADPDVAAPAGDEAHAPLRPETGGGAP